MAQIIGQIDSLTQLQFLLKEKDITFLSSLNEIIEFGKNFNNIIEKNKNDAEQNLHYEIDNLKNIISAMTEEYDIKINSRKEQLTQERDTTDSMIEKYSVKTSNIVKLMYNTYKRFLLKKRKFALNNKFELELKKPYKKLYSKIGSKKNDLNYLTENYDQIKEEKIKETGKELYKAKDILDENKLLIIGAIGERKAENELSKLPDSYTVINNFNLEISPPLFHKETESRIYSIQVDHLVIGPTGIFLIETKNWSKNSIKNLDLYSPVKQVKRANFALFCYLNDAVKQGILNEFYNTWGDVKISIRSILLMINAKPDQEFQYTKILDLNRIRSYITYFDQVFNEVQIEQIIDYIHNL